MSINNTAFTPGEQSDWSIIDIYWNVISFDDRIDIIESVEALPVTMFENDIVSAVNDSLVTVIQSDTWSWKTTQIPKMLQQFGSVVNTQPKVISARSLASRVSDELLADTWNPNYSVWVDVGFRTWQQVSSRHTSPLSFHTDWLELMRQSISWITPDVLILDEIHKYSIASEILAMKVRDTLLHTKEKMKLVLMSATIDPNILVNYFSRLTSEIPVLEIPWRTYPVERYFNSNSNYIKTIQTIYNWKTDEDWNVLEEWKNILLFVEWKKEIEENIAKLKWSLWNDAIIYPLHSEISIDEQIQILKKQSKQNVVIVATNIAEESITIDYLDVVIDLWRHKTVYYNNYWIEELIVENVSKASSDQRSWRVWRTHDWKYIRNNSTNYEELPNFDKAPIEKEMLDRYILLWLADWIDIRDLVLNKQKPFIHSPSVELLNLSYNKLQRLWAISDESRITKLWTELLKFPLSVNNAMILKESIDLWCSEDIIHIVAILEKKWFLSKSAKWQTLCSWYGLSEYNSDLLFYVQLYKVVTSKHLTDTEIEKLIRVGVSRKEIDIFKTLDWEKMLFEVVDLECIWIKTKKLYEIHNSIEILRARFEFLWYDIETIKDDISLKADSIKKCLISWNLDNIYKYNKKENFFYNHFENIPLWFRPWNVSLVNLRNGWLYIWSPFIIWWKDWKDDFNLLTNITEVWEENISEYYHRIIDGTYEFFWVEQARDAWVKMIRENDVEKLWIESTKPEYCVNVNSLQTKENTIEHLAKNWLPYYLVYYNNYVKKYIKSRWDNFNTTTFVELLKKITILEKHRINPNNMEKTFISFEKDTSILDMFLASDDEAIKAFLKWKDIRQVQNTKKKIKEIIGTPDEHNFEIQELIRLKKIYFNILTSIKTSNEVSFNTEKLKEKSNNELFDIIKDNISYNEFICEFITLKTFFEESWVDSRKIHLAFFKSITKKKRLLKKNEKDIVRLKKFKKYINRVISNWWLRKTDKVNDELKKYVSKKRYRKYRKSINLVKSEDKRQLARWIRRLKWCNIEIDALIAKKELDNETIIEDINLDPHPILKNAVETFKTLNLELYNQDYFNIAIIEKIYKFILKNLQQITAWNNILDIEEQVKIFIWQFDFSKLKIEEFKELYKVVEKYDDYKYELDAYKTQVLDWVKESRDISYIESNIKKLEILKTNIERIVKELRKNSL